MGRMRRGGEKRERGILSREEPETETEDRTSEETAKQRKKQAKKGRGMRKE
jgi:hypothetical protein